MGYMRLPPFATKKMTKVKKFNMQFVCMAGQAQINYICGDSQTMSGGDLITIPIHCEYEMINKTNDFLIIQFVKMIPS